jgi:hypothetical protein
MKELINFVIIMTITGLDCIEDRLTEVVAMGLS